MSILLVKNKIEKARYISELFYWLKATNYIIKLTTEKNATITKEITAMYIKPCLPCSTEY